MMNVVRVNIKQLEFYDSKYILVPAPLLLLRDNCYFQQLKCSFQNLRYVDINQSVSFSLSPYMALYSHTLHAVLFTFYIFHLINCNYLSIS